MAKKRRLSKLEKEALVFIIPDTEKRIAHAKKEIKIWEQELKFYRSELKKQKLKKVM